MAEDKNEDEREVDGKKESWIERAVVRWIVLLRHMLMYIFSLGNHLGQAREAKEERRQAFVGRRNNHLLWIAEMFCVKDRQAGKTEMIFEIYLAK